MSHWLSIILGAALFQRSALLEIGAVPSLPLLIVPLFAGLSEMAGQSFILVWRRVRLPQALASFGLTALVHVIGVSVWTAAALLTFHVGHGQTIASGLIFNIVAICYAPRLLSILTIAPYYGELLGRALDAWTMACVGWGFFAVAGASLPAATTCALAGWAVSHAVRHLGGHITAPLLNRLGLVVAGASNA